jgi:hypothetical protein
LTRILLLILAARALVPVALRPHGRDTAPWDICALRRCAWPKPYARQAYVKLVALVRESATTPSRLAAHVPVSWPVPALATQPQADRLDRYICRALGRPRC